MELPLFPLHTVLCPGVALPLHVFEDRYKTMVSRCLAEESPFGVVLIREGREVGPGVLAVAAVGTFAEIREATRYPDGRYDLVTLGTQRFRLEAVDQAVEPYLVGSITPMGEVLGEATHARLLGERVVQLFIRYLELLQIEERSSGGRQPRRGGRARGRERTASTPIEPPSDAGALREPIPETPGEPWAIGPDPDEVERFAADLADAYGDAFAAAERERAEAEAEAADPDAATGSEPAAATGSHAADGRTVDAAREAELDEAARRLTIPDDPTVLSYLLSGIVRVELIRRQGLLEMPTTELRLVELGHLLEREIALLERGLGSYTPDARLAALRRN